MPFSNKNINFSTSELRWWHWLQPAEERKCRWFDSGNTGGVWAPWWRRCFHQHQVHDPYLWILHAQLNLFHDPVPVPAIWCLSSSWDQFCLGIMMIKWSFVETLENCLTHKERETRNNSAALSLMTPPPPFPPKIRICQVDVYTCTLFFCVCNLGSRFVFFFILSCLFYSWIYLFWTGHSTLECYAEGMKQLLFGTGSVAIYEWRDNCCSNSGLWQLSVILCLHFTGGRGDVMGQDRMVWEWCEERNMFVLIFFYAYFDNLKF